MARPFTGQEYLDEARQLRKTAHTAHQLRTALAVLMPIEDGLSLEQTAAVLGVSKSATSMMRRRFFAKQLQDNTDKKLQPKRNRAIATLEQENQILDQLLAEAAVGGVVIVPPLLPKIQGLLGKPICLATLYNMLHRHGWRKLAPNTYHPKDNPQAREEFKKTPQ